MHDHSRGQCVEGEGWLQVRVGPSLFLLSLTHANSPVLCSSSRAHECATCIQRGLFRAPTFAARMREQLGRRRGARPPAHYHRKRFATDAAILWDLRAEQEVLVVVHGPRIGGVGLAAVDGDPEVTPCHVHGEHGSVGEPEDCVS